VNSFRLILRRYFDAALPPLRDEAYVFRDHEHPYDLVRVTDRVGERRGAAWGYEPEPPCP
jgi:hypothetical protein